MNPKFRYQGQLRVSNQQTGIRLDRFVHEQCEEFSEQLSRSKIQELIDLGLITVNGKVLKSSYKTKDSDLVSISLPELEPSDLQHYDFPIHIIFEDQHCLVIHKPAGLVVHPAAGHFQDTLVNALLHKVSDLNIGFDKKRPGIVHRLDKDTSGILVVAKTNQALENLSAQFKQKTAQRLYHALVYGRPTAREGRIESYLERHPTHRKKFRSGEQGKKAITHYRLIGENQGISLLQCRLETGRTHQIRVHLSEMGCPIVNDPIYSHPRRTKSLNSRVHHEIKEMVGIGLHAFQLGFNHPTTGEFMKFEEDWPITLKSLVETLNFKDV